MEAEEDGGPEIVRQLLGHADKSKNNKGRVRECVQNKRRQQKEIKRESRRPHLYLAWAPGGFQTHDLKRHGHRLQTEIPISSAGDTHEPLHISACVKPATSFEIA